MSISDHHHSIKTIVSRFVCFVGMGMYESFRNQVLRMSESSSSTSTPSRLGKRKRESSEVISIANSPSRSSSLHRPSTPLSPSKRKNIECGLQDLKLVIPEVSGLPKSYTYCYLVPSTSGLVTQYQVWRITIFISRFHFLTRGWNCEA
jgi:hypothetical protein